MRLRTPRLLEILKRIYNRLFEVYLDTQSHEIADRILAECQTLTLLIQSLEYLQDQPQHTQPPLTQSPEESLEGSGLDDA